MTQRITSHEDAMEIAPTVSALFIVRATIETGSQATAQFASEELARSAMDRTWETKPAIVGQSLWHEGKLLSQRWRD